MGSNGHPHTFSYLTGLDRIGFRKQYHELFSAIAPNGISPTQAVAHTASQFLQYGIANAMAVGIIDPLEMIAIKEEDG